MCVFDALVIVLLLCIYYLRTAHRCQYVNKEQVLSNDLELITAKKELVLVQEELVTLRAELMRLHLQDVECQAFRKRIWNHVIEMQSKHELKMTRHAHSWHGSSYAKYQNI